MPGVTAGASTIMDRSSDSGYKQVSDAQTLFLCIRNQYVLTLQYCLWRCDGDAPRVLLCPRPEEQNQDYVGQQHVAMGKNKKALEKVYKRY